MRAVAHVVGCGAVAVARGVGGRVRVAVGSLLVAAALIGCGSTAPVPLTVAGCESMELQLATAVAFPRGRVGIRLVLRQQVVWCYAEGLL